MMTKGAFKIGLVVFLFATAQGSSQSVMVKTEAQENEVQKYTRNGKIRTEPGDSGR